MMRPRNHDRFYTALKKSHALLRIIRQYVRFNHLLFASVFFLSAFSFWLSYEFRFDFDVPKPYNAERLLLVPYVAVFKLLVFYILGVHSSNWRYVGLTDIPRLVIFGVMGSIALILARVFSNTLVVPKGVILIDFFLSLVLIGGTRVSVRYLRELTQAYLIRSESPDKKPAIVIGAGDAGEMMVREIARNPRSGLDVRALFDDDVKKIGQSIHGIRVLGRVGDVPEYVQDNDILSAIIAIPSANNVQMKRIYHIMKGLDISVKTLPTLHEIIEGSEKLKQLRDIDITDLLGREEIQIDSGQVRDLVFNKVVAVTGAGGSIGGELCRQIIKRNPGQLILIERAENNLFHIYRRLRETVDAERASNIVPILCDVRDEFRIDYEFDRCRPELVFHAGAHKHVPLQELNPLECFSNNIKGIRTLARASDKFGVSTFLLISTDKAVNPTSIMGASKRVCEIYCQAFGKVSATKFMSVRFGNVLASEGSVVPLLMDQIAHGGPVTVTHPEMRRYFMTIPEAVTLVLQAAALGKTGQILALEMGEPIKIVDMVQQLVQLVGKDPDEIPIEFVGMRPGEKLLEEIYSDKELVLETGHPKIRAFDPPGGEARGTIDEIDRAIGLVDASNDSSFVKRILKQLVPEYAPWHTSSGGTALQ